MTKFNESFADSVSDIQSFVLCLDDTKVTSLRTPSGVSIIVGVSVVADPINVSDFLDSCLWTCCALESTFAQMKLCKSHIRLQISNSI